MCGIHPGAAKLRSGSFLRCLIHLGSLSRLSLSLAIVCVFLGWLSRELLRNQTEGSVWETKQCDKFITALWRSRNF